MLKGQRRRKLVLLTACSVVSIMLFLLEEKKNMKHNQFSIGNVVTIKCKKFPMTIIGNVPNDELKITDCLETDIYECQWKTVDRGAIEPSPVHAGPRRIRHAGRGQWTPALGWRLRAKCNTSWKIRRRTSDLIESRI